MNTFLHKLKLIIHDEQLRNRVLFIFGALIIFRLLAVVPVPGVDAAMLAQFFSSNQFLGLLNLFSGGGLSHLSVVMLGVGPYITASIIMQLLTVMSPKMKSMYTEEGDAGRKKFMQYSRLLTLPLATLQAFSFLMLLESQGIVKHLGVTAFMGNLIVIIAGSMLLMWLGELVTEFGIGNGVSIIIFSGIVARIPQLAGQTLFSFDMSQVPVYLAFLAATVVIIAAVVLMTEAERPVPITYAKQVRGGQTYGGVSTYLPLRMNQAGVIPIIFALSILLFPQMILNILSYLKIAGVSEWSAKLLEFTNNQWLYAGVYFVLVFAFTYFYTAVTFDPDAMAKNLQRNGAFIPGIRPGEHTAEYIGTLITRLTFMGALFLGVVAVLPLIMKALTGIVALAVGGTALLIVVSVVLDLIRRIDSQIEMREF
jgi:preprotein translocase subunit SecY